MTSPIGVGIIGANRYAAALEDYAAPLAGAAVSAIAPSPNGRDRTAAAALARRLPAAFARDWGSVARDPALGVVLVASDDPGRGAAVEAALGAGKIVVCPAPAATTTEALDRLSAVQTRGHGVLLASGEIRHTPAGARAVALAAAGGLGTLHSIYAAVRLRVPTRASGADSVLDRVGWDLLDTLCAAVPHAPRRVHATVAGLFGGTEDTAAIVARLGDETIATIDLSRCLPASIPTVPQGEVEIEMIGSRDALRLEPYRTAVRFHGERGAARLPWIDEPVLSMLHEGVRIAAGEAARPNHFEHFRRVVGFMDAVKASAARGDTVTVA
ncbi:MAG TPA: Gfo/Idh/MocA family oxidoreductase [bacterium]|nr:Gfo/Idh/MocA family oxidoreductase [bacterium]